MNYRVYVKKKEAFRVEADSLFHELKQNLNLSDVHGIELYNVYDVFNGDDHDMELLKDKVLSEKVTDEVFDEIALEGKTYIAYECLPGQYDQRADSAQQCLMLLNNKQDVVIKSGKIVILDGSVSEEELIAIKNYLINPVEMREKDLSVLINEVDVEIEAVPVLEGFCALDEAGLEALRQEHGLAMTLADIAHVQKYFKEEEQRDLTLTELKVLDTYWSDHCRHTTFETILQNVTFDAGSLQDSIQKAYETYLHLREEVHGNKKVMTLMDMATIAGKYLRKNGKLEDMEVSDEINACSIEITVDVDGEDQQWLLMFKNETHNHPTEIEPFGGASTCIGGAIRDPLSGRSYVYQAMRITGAGDITKDIKEALPNKLPQSRISKGAAAGYSSYGNQIGLATGYVKELYHPGYVAKRMEIGAVMGAAPRKYVKRLTSDPGDIIILLGGRTGRDGIGGATGSSKVHTTASIEVCGAEVQKGNAPTERKIQRMFRRPEVSSIIKKCNDFGAGGVSVAIGELAAGLQIDLDKVPKKYAGLDGTEIAISESQERMAVVVDPADVEKFLGYAAEENLEAVTVAVVTEDPRLVMNWRGKTIVDISRAFLDTNGAHQEADVTLEVPAHEGNLFDKKEVGNVKDKWLNMLSDLNVCSQKGLVERFDGSIGAGSVFMPFGGKYQLTETQSMVAKLPVLEGHTDTVTMMSYGFDPYLSSWSPYHGAVYAVVSSVAKIVAAGGDYKKIRFTFQEYFRRMSSDPTRWSQPFAALLGAYNAQMGFGLPSIGGKDSMSGTFDDEHGEINVPPTLVSFAVDVNSCKNIITPEFKKAGSKIVEFKINRDNYDLPDYAQIMDGYGKLFEDIKAGKILSAYAVEGRGAAEAVSKMAFGNKMGVKIEHNVDPRDFFGAGWGNIVCEVAEGKVGELSIPYTLLGEVTDKGVFEYGNTTITMDEALASWMKTLEDVFPTVTGKEKTGEAAKIEEKLYDTDTIYICDHKLAQPEVFIPVFPGTNCEYDSTKAFERAGAKVVTKVFKNLSAQDIRESVEEYKKEIAKAQIIMFPGGFSAGDEPDGSAKFFATVFRNAVIKEEVEKLLNERDGLMLGICNGFQALIKLGLVPEGKITEQKPNSPTLAMNTIGRHISKMVYTKVMTNKSPWLAEAKLGGVYCNPASHGEGRFVADEAWLHRLIANGQVATQYVDDKGNVTMDEYWNPNGSYMAIEGITSPDGRILGKMAHSERRGEAVAMNIYGEQDMKIFESGVKYFK